MKTLDDFLKEYSPNNLNFDKIDYRRGARIVDSFGLVEGYTVQDDKSLVFDTIRLHTGVDRSGIYGTHEKQIENIVICPFNFNRSNIVYYGPRESYGTLIQLFNDDYKFEMRIAHMNPVSDLRPDIKIALEKRLPIKMGTILGKAGNYGLSGGIHTHTEFISLGDCCEIFEKLLYEKFGSIDVVSEYTKMDILKIYQSKAKWTGKSAENIFAHYASLKKQRGADFINRFMYKYIEIGSLTPRTRYSSELLFNGL